MTVNAPHLSTCVARLGLLHCGAERVACDVDVETWTVTRKARSVVRWDLEVSIVMGVPQKRLVYKGKSINGLNGGTHMAGL
jgi:hypothetical protein